MSRFLKLEQQRSRFRAGPPAYVEIRENDEIAMVGPPYIEIYDG